MKTTRLPSGMLRYQLYIGTINGKRKYKSFTGARKKDIAQQVNDWMSTHGGIINGSTQFQDICEQFLANRKAVLSPSTYADYIRRKNYLQKSFPLFFKTTMDHINSEQVQAIVNVLAEGKSSKSVLNYYGFISVVCKSAGLSLNCRLPQKQVPDLNIPEEDIVKKILELTKGTELYIPVILAAFGPMREGEICALQLEDIDGNIAHVHKTIARSEHGFVVKETPKTTAGNRFIELPEQVTDLIKKQGYVTKLSPNALYKRWHRLLKNNNIQDMRFHDLRHFAASFLLSQADMPQYYVMDRGGWSSPTSMRRYIHALDKQRKEYAGKANQSFEKLL